jgi:hypothetical protein
LEAADLLVAAARFAAAALLLAAALFAAAGLLAAALFAAAGLLAAAALPAALALFAAAALSVGCFFSRYSTGSARLLADALYRGVFEVDDVEAFRARDFLVVVICNSA